MKSILLFSGICRRHFSNLAFGLFLQITFTHFDDYSIQILIPIIAFCKKMYWIGALTQMNKWL
jgi:hypothetical protein